MDCIRVEQHRVGDGVSTAELYQRAKDRCDGAVVACLGTEEVERLQLERESVVVSSSTVWRALHRLEPGGLNVTVYRLGLGIGSG